MLLEAKVIDQVTVHCIQVFLDIFAKSGWPPLPPPTRCLNPLRRHIISCTSCVTVCDSVALIKVAPIALGCPPFLKSRGHRPLVLAARTNLGDPCDLDEYISESSRLASNTQAWITVKAHITTLPTHALTRIRAGTREHTQPTASPSSSFSSAARSATTSSSRYASHPPPRPVPSADAPIATVRTQIAPPFSRASTPSGRLALCPGLAAILPQAPPASLEPAAPAPATSSAEVPTRTRTAGRPGRTSVRRGEARHCSGLKA